MKEVVYNNKLSVCAILETHVIAPKLKKICDKVFGNWKWTSNQMSCDRGTRIILGWNPNDVYIMILNQTNQVLHCLVNLINDKKQLYCSFVYAANKPIERRHLWKALHLHKHVVSGKPWVLLGDFNVALNIEDSKSGTSGFTRDMWEFKECVEDIEVGDINQTGVHYTWNQKPHGDLGILKKLDRIMGNTNFISDFPRAFASFQPYRISDHIPVVLRLPIINKSKPKPFKFINFITKKADFFTDC